MADIEVVTNSVLASAKEFLSKYLLEKFSSDGSETNLEAETKIEDQNLKIERYALSDVRTQPIGESDQIFRALIAVYNFETSRQSERLRQARWSFNVALALLVIGTFVILAGTVLVFRSNHVTAGIVSSVSGVISNFISAILFKFSRDANDRLDKIKTDLVKIESFRQMLTILSQSRNS